MKILRVKLLLIACLFIKTNVISQITVTDVDLVDIGDVIYQAYDDAPSSSVIVGSSGTNQIWDFSSLQSSYTDTLFFLDPVSTVHSSLYSNVNLSMLKNGSTSYFNKTSSGMYLHGLSDTLFNSPALFYPLPLTYSLTVSDGPILVIDNVITGPLLNTALPPTTVSLLTNGLADRADTAIIKITNTTDFFVDGSGTITTPLGTFSVLRLKSIKYTNSILDIYCTNTVSGFGSWYNNISFTSIPFLASYDNTAIEYKYEWLTNDSTVHFLVAEAIVDSLDNILGGISFQNFSHHTYINKLPSNICRVYPVPATHILNVEMDCEMKVHLIFRDAQGKLIKCSKFDSKTNLPLDGLTKGVYYLTLLTEQGTLTKQILLE